MQAFLRVLPVRLRAVLAAALLACGAGALAACGDMGTAGGTGSTAPTETAPATTTGTATGATVTVFFPDAASEALVRTPVPAASTNLRAAMDALAAGPPGSSLDPGLPEGTRVLGATASGGVATVDLSKEFSDGYPAGGSAAEFRALAPLVYTATAVEGVDSVRITVDGATPVVMTQFDLSQPLTRRDLPSPAEIR
jgi:spore germination protein GerM